MSWRDELWHASFRGVDCLYDDADDERGRRLAVHEYPQRDEADVEDMGRRVRRYRITLYLLASALGANYTRRREELIAALERGGVGTLVHPHYGPLDVHVERFAPSYSTARGGMTRLRCEFIEAAGGGEPRQSLRTDALMRSQVDVFVDQIGAAFRLVWSLARLPEPARDSAREVLAIASDALAVPAGSTRREWQPATVSGDTLSDAGRVFGRLAVGRQALAAGGLSRVRDARSLSADLYAALPELADALDSSRGGSTVAVRAGARNLSAVLDAADAITLAAGLDVVSRTLFDSVDDAIAARDEFVEQIDRIAETAPDPVYRALQDVRAALVRDIQARGAGLPNVRSLTPDVTEPALVLAHRLYGDATRDADIVARNRIVHPGFVPGGQPIEVLTNVA